MLGWSFWCGLVTTCLTVPIWQMELWVGVCTDSWSSLKGTKSTNCLSLSFELQQEGRQIAVPVDLQQDKPTLYVWLWELLFMISTRCYSVSAIWPLYFLCSAQHADKLLRLVWDMSPYVACVCVCVCVCDHTRALSNLILNSVSPSR